MGEPVECAHANPDNGDTLQQTTTGLGFYRKSTNTPTFTDGASHWALTSDGLIYWTGNSIDPPGLTPPTAAVLSEPEIAAHAAPAVVQVLAGDNAGSGVSVSAGVLTNEHVVHGMNRVDLFTSDGQRFGATVRSTDLVRDLALLAPDLPIPMLEMEPVSQQRQGDQVLVLGYPRPSALGIGGGQASLVRGLLSATRQENEVTLIQTDALVNPGNSGGPVLNMRGNVIGIVAFGLKESVGLNFAVASESIQAFLAAPLAIAQPPITPTATSVSSPAASPPVASDGLFHGDPRLLALRLDEIGAGFAKTYEEGGAPSNTYSVTYSRPGQRVVSYVAVNSTLADAQAVWASWSSGQIWPDESIVTPVALGDAAFAKRRPDGQLARVLVSEANVIAWVALERRDGVPADTSIVVDYARHVVDHAPAALMNGQR